MLTILKYHTRRGTVVSLTPLLLYPEGNYYGRIKLKSSTRNKRRLARKLRESVFIRSNQL